MYRKHVQGILVEFSEEYSTFTVLSEEVIYFISTSQISKVWLKMKKNGE